MRFAPRYLSHYDFDFGGDLLAGRRVEIVDCGDVATTPSAIQENPSRVTTVIRKILERRAVPVVLGGEHSIPIPVMRAYEGYGPIFIVHVDAHLDWRDELGGVREGLSSPLRRASEMPWFSGMPRVESILVQHPSLVGPYGAKGVGEPPNIEPPAAVANAVAAATGLRVTSLPITAEKIALGLVDTRATWGLIDP